MIAWLLVVVLALAVAGLVFALLQASEDPEPADTPTAADSPGPSSEPTPTETADAMPLLPPADHFPASGVSAIPLSEDSLEDGDYFGFLHGIDTGAPAVDLDIAIFYSGQAAIDYLAANEPDEENPPPNGYYIVNDVERLRTVPLSPDVRIWDWCYGEEDLNFVERPLANWAAATTDDFDLDCSYGTSMGRDPSGIYWLDVRGGTVMQVIGQFLP